MPYGSDFRPPGRPSSRWIAAFAVVVSTVLILQVGLGLEVWGFGLAVVAAVYLAWLRTNRRAG
jgi:hypothetical protein